MQNYISYHNLFSDFSYCFFGQNLILGQTLWRAIVVLALFYSFYVSSTLLKSQKHINLNKSWLIFFVLIIASKISIWGNSYFNVDEAQTIASAAKLASGSKLFLDVDGTSQGPIMLFLISLIPKLGISLNYSTLRIFDTLAIWIPSIFMIYKIGEKLSDKYNSFLMIIPIIMYYISLNFHDFIAFNSERFPFLFIIASAYLIICFVYNNKSKYAYLQIFLIGLFASLMSLAKLQSGPFSFAIFVYICYYLSKEANLSKSDKHQYILAFFIGILSPILILFVYLKSNDLLYDFRIRFIETTIFYSSFGLSKSSQNLGLVHKLFTLSKLLFGIQKWMSFFVPFSIYLYLIKINHSNNITNQIHKNIVLFIIMLFCACMIAMGTSGNKFAHYMMYFVAVFFVSFAVLFASYFKDSKLNVKIYSILLIPNILMIYLGSVSYKKDFTYYINANKSKSEQYFTYNNNKFKSIAVWGWDSNLYLESQSLQASAISHTYFQIVPSKYREYYQIKYIEELERNKAELFVDVVSKGAFFFEEKNEQFENFPIIANYIKSNFVFDTTIANYRYFKSIKYFNPLKVK